MALASLEPGFRPVDATVLDYPALVTLLGAHQQRQPIARAARAMDDAGDTQPAMDALIALLTGGSSMAAPAATSALSGRFNPAVPFSDSASSIGKGW